jgi:hypothetical protein
MRNNIIGTKNSLKNNILAQINTVQSTWNKILIVFALPDESP